VHARQQNYSSGEIRTQAAAESEHRAKAFTAKTHCAPIIGIVTICTIWVKLNDNRGKHQ